MTLKDLLKNTGIIIQARTNSSRFPKKILKKINGNTILDFMLKRVNRVNYCKKILATTTHKADKILIKIAKKNNFFTFRGKENDVLSRYYHCAKFYELKYIVRLTSDCPLIDPKLITTMLKKFFDRNYDYYSNTTPLKESTFPNGSDIEIFSFKALTKNHKLCKNLSDREHVTNFFFNNKKIFKIGKYISKINYSNIRYTLDYPLDLTRIRSIYKCLQTRNIFGTTKQIISIIKDLESLNGKYPKKKN